MSGTSDSSPEEDDSVLELVKRQNVEGQFKAKTSEIL